MDRRELLKSALALAASAAFPAAAAWGQQQPPPPLEVTRLAGRLYLLSGRGGNIAVLAEDGGTLLVDSGVAPASAEIARAVRSVRDQPVTTLINTHWHADHTGGNARFGAAGARIVAHVNVRKRLRAPQFIAAFNQRIPAAPKPALPTRTFSAAQTVRHGGQTLRLTHAAPAHTDSDVFVYFARENVLHAGDLFFSNGYPFIDYSTGGNLPGMIAGADRLLSVADANTKIIPGHGPLTDRARLKAYRDMLALVRARVEPQVKAGRTVDEIIAARPTRDLDAVWGNGFFKAEQFVRFVQGGYTAAAAKRA